MKTRIIRTGIPLLTSLCFGTVASAGPVEPGFYFGAGGGPTSFDSTRQEIDTTVSTGFEDLGFLFVEPESKLDDSDTGFTGLVGYRFNRGLAAEAAYAELGELTYTATGTAAMAGDDGLVVVPARADLSVEATGVAVSLLGILPSSDRLELFVRGGVLFADIEKAFPASAGTFFADFGSRSESSTDYLAGLGGNVHFGERWSVRLEYQRFLDVGDEETTESDIDLVSLGFLLRL